MLLLARVLGSGLGGVTSVQPALPFLLTGWTLAAAAQAQTSMINFQADSLNTTSFMVTWDDVAGDTYSVRYGEGDLPKPTSFREFNRTGTTFVSTKLHGGQREVRFIGLKKETQYTVYLRVQRSPSTNSFYEKLTVTTPATDPVINTKVENLVVQPRVAQLTLRWTRTGIAEGGYKISWRKEDETNFKMEDQVTVKFSIGGYPLDEENGLEEGTSYFVQVESLDRDGSIIADTAVSATAETRTAGNVNEPRNLTLALEGTLGGTQGVNRIRVNWSRAGGETSGGYRVRWREAVAGATLNEGVKVAPKSRSDFTRYRTEIGAGSLTAGKTYFVQVDTLNREGSPLTGGAVSDMIKLNRAPSRDKSIPNQEAIIDTSFNYTFPDDTFSDADSDTLTYEAKQTDGTTDSDLPSWLTFSSGTRTFSGTPTSSDSGTLSVKLTASDGALSASATFTLQVAADTAPAFGPGVTIPDQTWTVDQEITAFTLPAATGGNRTVYDLTPALPTGVSLNTSTREVSGTPTVAAAQATYTWLASDSDSNTENSDSDSLTFMVTVNKFTLGTPPKPEIKANTRDSTSFTVTWDAVPNAADYTATATPSSGTAVTGAVSTSGTEPEAVFTGLTTNTAYTVTVMATGDANYADSAASDGLAVVTLPAAGVASTAVTNLEVTPGNMSLMVSWTAATVAPHGYSVRWRYTGLDLELGKETVIGTSYTIRRGLLNGETYEVVVETRNRANDDVETGTAVKAEGTPSGLDLVPSTLTSVVEGGSDTYTVKLTAQPTGNVTVTPIVPDNTDVTVSPSSLTFTSLNWSNDQTVTVSVASDDDAVTDRPVTITHSTSGGGFDSMTAGTVEVIIIENDEATFSVTGPATVTEDAGTATYAVSLSIEPGSGVTVDYATSNGTATAGSDYTAESGTLTFTRDSWNTPQTVNVPITNDRVDDDDETFTFTLSNPTRGTSLSSSASSVNTTIVDDDTSGVTVSKTNLTVPEGGSDEYTVVLDSEPTGPVTVTPMVPDDTDVTVSPSSLTFTTLNWNAAQTVTVSAAEDDDADNDPTVTLTHAVSGAADYASVEADSVAVTITENDTPGVTLSETNLAVPEGGSATYTVKLPTQPTGNVTVTVSGASGDVTVDTDTLTFTTLNWDDAQTVTVSAAEDDDAADDPTVMITHSRSGASSVSVTVTITENDEATFSVTGPATVTEDAGMATYAVSLSIEPGSDVTVDYATSNGTATAGSDYTAESGTLTFTRGSWNTPQTVDVPITNDRMDDDDETFTFTLSNPTRGTSLSSSASSVNTTIVDDDTSGVTLSETNLTVPEGGSDNYTVVLDSEPTGNVTVTVGGASGDVTVDTDTLTFTNTNWDAPQTVTVSADEDDDAVDDPTVTLNHSVTGGDYGGSVTVESVMVTITENDTPGVTLSNTNLQVTEGGSDNYTVELDSEPTGPVTVTVGGASGDVTVDTDTMMPGNQTTLTFTNTNWDAPQTVTVSADEDDDAVDDPTVTLTHSVSGADADYDSLTAGSVAVMIIDNDTPGVTLSKTNLQVTEGGSDNYTVVLDSEPTGPVTVTVGGASGDVTVDTDTMMPGNQTTLTFTNTNWDAPQTVRVSAAEDDDAVDDPTVTLTHSVSGADADYDSLTAGSVAVMIIDNDTPGVTLSEINLTVTEGSFKNYTVVLDSEPTGPVTVTVGGASGDVTVDTDTMMPGNQTTLTFTNANWKAPQTVRVSAAEDDDAADDPTVTLTHSVTGGDYGGSVTVESVMVTIMENEEELDQVNEKVLPSVLNQVTGKQIAVITDRFATISSGSHMGSLSMEEMVTDVADYLLSHHQEIQVNGFDWRQALSGNSFSFALADASVSQGSMDMDDGEPSSSSSGPVSFWGGIDYFSLEDKIEGLGLYGDITSFNFGVDKEFRSDLVAGILLSIANSEFDLTQGSTDSVYEVDISTVNPYISWEASEDFSLWASVGYGRGQADLTYVSTDPPDSKSGDFTRFSAGGRFQLWQSEAGTALALKLDGTTAHFLEADVQSSRLATELSHDFSIESGVLNLALELGLLMSSADESAAELASRLHWQGDAGFSVSARSRVLLGGGDRKEWGIGGALRYTTGGAGEGLMMSLEPSLGISNPRLLSDLWSATRSDLAFTTEAPTVRLNAAIAYGFPTSDGLLTPYTDFSFSETTSSYAAGLRYGLSTGWNLDLKGMRQTSTTDAAENTILLELLSDR